MSAHSDTIFALASAPGRAGVAVIRVSGPRSHESLKALSARDAFTPRMGVLCQLKHPQSAVHLDAALVLPFKAPASYTGEDVVEYHLHGGKAVIASVLEVLATQDGHRMAEPGEFTRRAFENGKMDLTAAEAVADLIDAETQAQRLQALSQMEGALSALYTRWTDRLTKTLAHMEADIEFPDEDLPDGIAPEVSTALQDLIAQISVHLDDNRRGERLRDGIHVVLLGAPNAGKSSLLNALAQREAAIISDTPGTTRDIIEVHLDISGYPVILSDTAGLRPEQLGDEGHDAIESEGIRRALERAASADIKLLVFDGCVEEPDPHTLNLVDEDSILLINKSDMAQEGMAIDGAIAVSAKNEDGLTKLLKILGEKVEARFGLSEVPSLTRQRHRAHVEEALECLKRAGDAALPELTAEDVRLALRALGRITGRVDVEDLLDVVFRDFCIGK